MAMVVRANRDPGRHRRAHLHLRLAATLYEVASTTSSAANRDGYDGDQIYFQGHAAPGMYARAFLEGR
jgi:pyruvate dehydrogenase E1 component